MTPDANGFPSPVIQAEKCVDCNLCNQVCPAIHPPKAEPFRKAYAAQYNDGEALKDSSSGGVFTALSREFFRRGGLVYGCVWDEQYRAVVRRAENEEEMKPMRGSKYVWSWAGDTYPEIERELKQGRTVLFTGLPCQTAGLKNYLRKEYPGLYLVTFFCGGSPSPYAFQRYLETITRDVPLSELDFQFRDKARYGGGVNISYNTRKGRVHQSYLRNPYFYSYRSKIVHRMCCYQCQFRYRDRLEDITIGDYWGVEHYHPDLNIRAGVSAILINTDKGAELLDAVRDQLILRETRAEYISAHGNLSLTDAKKVFHIPEYRDAFFRKMKNQGWTAAERRYLYTPKRMMLWLMPKLPKGMQNALNKVLRRG